MSKLSFFASLLCAFTQVSKARDLAQFPKRQSQQAPAVLPSPNGTYNVGLVTAELVNTDQPDMPFAPNGTTQPSNILEISVFYPSSSKQTQPQLYFPPETAAFLDIEHAEVYALPSPPGTFERVELQLAPNQSEILTPPQSSGWPLLMFSPAQGTTRLFYNVIAQTVAASGYVVVTVDAPYDVDFEELSDGSNITANTNIQITLPNVDIAVTARVNDISYVIDQLSNQTYASQLIPGCTSTCINTTEVGMYGHSLGGASTAQALANVSKIIGGVNMDGALFALPVVQQGFSKPFLFMGAQGQFIQNYSDPGDFAGNETQVEQATVHSIYALWQNLKGYHAEIVLNDSMHYTFSDMPLVFQQLGLELNSTAMQDEQVTDQDGNRSIGIITSYIIAFFNMVMKGQSSPLLEGNSADFPEVTFNNFTAPPTPTTSGSPSGSASSTAVATPNAGHQIGIQSLALLGLLGVGLWLS